MRRILIMIGCVIRHIFMDDTLSQPISLWEHGAALWDITPLPSIERSIRIRLPIYDELNSEKSSPNRS